jgi:hypothetical protein
VARKGGAQRDGASGGLAAPGQGLGRGAGEGAGAGDRPILRRQNPDSGWGQIKDAPSDAYATGQALYALSLAGVEFDRAKLRLSRNRGVEC